MKNARGNNVISDGLNLTINYSLVDKGSESSEITELIYDLKNKQYVFSIIPEKIIHMNNGIKYYYVEAECNESKVIINAYGKQAEELFEEAHKHSFLKNSIAQ
jgi:hypothetical protein